MSRIPRTPRVNLSLSVEEILALRMVLTLGKMFSRPKELKQVESIFRRIGGRLEVIGLDHDVAERLVKL